MNSLYGSYRTRTFADIFPSVDEFRTEYTQSNLYNISGTSTVKLYYLLYAQYGNSHIANSDENQFKYKLFSIIYMYGPSWEKRLEIQLKLRSLSDDELVSGSKQIYNHAFNPNTAPSTNSLEELNYINDQNTANYKRGKLDAYMTLWDAIKTDVTNEFLTKFKKCFLQIVEPQDPLYYITHNEED